MKHSTNQKLAEARYIAPEVEVMTFSVERGFNMSMPEIDDEVDKQISGLDKWTEWED